MKKILGILAGVALVVASVGVGAQEKYPNQPVRLIVPFPPGGGTDLVSRVIATELSKSTGWAVAPDNKPGSGGSMNPSSRQRRNHDRWVHYTIIAVLLSPS